MNILPTISAGVSLLMSPLGNQSGQQFFGQKFKVVVFSEEIRLIRCYPVDKVYQFLVGIFRIAEKFVVLGKVGEVESPEPFRETGDDKFLLLV